MPDEDRETQPNRGSDLVAFRLKNIEDLLREYNQANQSRFAQQAAEIEGVKRKQQELELAVARQAERLGTWQLIQASFTAVAASVAAFFGKQP